MGYGPGSKVAVPDEQQQQQQRQNNIGRTWLTVYRGCRTSDEKTNQFCQHPLDSLGGALVVNVNFEDLSDLLLAIQYSSEYLL